MNTLKTTLVGTLFSLCACSDSGGQVVDESFKDSATIAAFADNVVVPTYALLKTRTVALQAALDTLAATTTPPNLEAARTAWEAMREPWEQAEGFLFGPVDAAGYDPAMDSWPLNKTDLDNVLASNDAFSQAYVAALAETQKGFHTVEYLLWGQDSDKVANDLTPRELEFATALADEFVNVTTLLEQSWTMGVNGGLKYRDVFATAGAAGNTAYPSVSAAVDEMLAGMSGICDEVANGKIADPYDARDENLVESQYSFNSLLDFADNIESVRNVYTGDFPLGLTAGPGLDDFVKAKAPALDARMTAELDDAIAKIGAIPAPFRAAIKDPANDAKIEAAQAAIRTLQATIDGDLTQLLKGE